MFNRLRRNLRNNRGSILLEYSLLVAGIALIGAAAVATFGHKTNDMLAAAAAVIPGAHADDNAPIISGRIIETAVGTKNGAGDVNAIALDIDAITTNSDGTKVRLGTGLGLANGAAGAAQLSDLVVEPK